MCSGCVYEFEEALRLQEEGYFFATSIDREFDCRRHFMIFMVDRFGKIVVW